MVYRKLLVNASNFEAMFCDCYSRRHQYWKDQGSIHPAILRANKLICREALPIMYSDNTFQLTCAIHKFNVFTAGSICPPVGLSSTPYPLRQVVVDINVTRPLDPPLPTCGGALSRFPEAIFQLNWPLETFTVRLIISSSSVYFNLHISSKSLELEHLLDAGTNIVRHVKLGPCTGCHEWTPNHIRSLFSGHEELYSLGEIVKPHRSWRSMYEPTQLPKTCNI